MLEVIRHGRYRVASGVLEGFKTSPTSWVRAGVGLITIGFLHSHVGDVVRPASDAECYPSPLFRLPLRPPWLFLIGITAGGWCKTQAAMALASFRTSWR